MPIPVTADPSYKRIPRSDLHPFQGELKELQRDEYDKLKASIEAEGFFEPVEIWTDEAGKHWIIDGHQRLFVCEKEGWELGDDIPTRPMPADDREHAARRLLALNSRFGRMTGQGLYEFMHSFEIDPSELDKFSLSDIDIDSFKLEFFEDNEVPPGDEDAVPEVPEDPTSRLGDLWLLGEHRVLCGDCTSADNVERLGLPADAVMITDPPYNVGFDYTENIDDEKDDAQYKEFSRAWFDLWASLTARQIVTPGSANLALWYRWFDVYHCAPWIKLNAMTNGKVARWWVWEAILFFGASWNRKRSNDVFDFAVGMQKDTGNHPCPKPIKLWVELIEQYTDEGAAIAEPFGGSGTTLIAAEKTGRTCFATELDPGYTDLQVKRWQDYTGKDATLDGDGRTFNEIANGTR